MTSSRPSFAIAVTLFLSVAAHAGTLHGSVINRTTGKPVAGITVTLVQPQGGMIDLGSGKSDSLGAFSFDNNAIGSGPVLVRAEYQGVKFNAFVPPGRPDVTVDVYEISKDPKTVTITSHVIIFQPSGDKLIGAEEYGVLNNSQPPVAYLRTEGNFEFAIPEKGTLQQVATTGSTGMAVTQAPIEKGNGRFAIAHAFRPGETSVRLSYELPYSGNTAAVKLPALYSGMRLLLVAPPGITLTGEGINPAGQEQGMMVYTHQPLAAKSALSLTIAGAGTPQSASSDGAQQQQQEVPQQGNSRTGSEIVQSVPGRLDDFKWPLLGGMALLFALSAALLWRKQVIVAPVAEISPELAAPPPPDAKSAPKKSATDSSAAPDPVAIVNEQVAGNLEALKESIFRLELRHQAGTISEEEYARERVRVEKLLRDLVRG